MKDSFLIGKVTASGTLVPQISTEISVKDFLGAIMVRWGINRNKYRVGPGLYAVGTPGPESEVFVTANYKLTFDILRKT